MQRYMKTVTVIVVKLACPGAVRLASVAPGSGGLGLTPGSGGLSLHAVHIQRLISRASTEGSTGSYLVCNRWLMLDLETLSISRCSNNW